MLHCSKTGRSRLLETAGRPIKVINFLILPDGGAFRAASPLSKKGLNFMTTRMFRGLLVATAAAAILAASGAQAADKLSSAVQAKLAAVQKAANAKDYATAKADLNDANQIADRTPADNYAIAQFSMSIDYSMKDIPGAATAAQAMADSPAQPDADKAKNAQNAMILSLQAKQYDKALPYAKTLAATNPTDPGTRDAIVQAYYFGNDFADAQAAAQKEVDAAVAAHQTPSRNTLEMLQNAQVKAKDEAGAEKTLEMSVAYYNDPSDWSQIIDVAISSKGVRDLDEVWLGRLLFLSGATVSSADASLIGSVASHLTFFGDAQVAQQHGGTGFPDANAAANKDKATMTAQIAAGQKQNGNYNAKIAEALYSYGMYPEAEAAARLAIQKGGAVDPSEPPMVLAQSLIAQGKYDEGIATLGQVTGGGPATPRIVRLWVDYANVKKNPPAGATAAK
jgi:hypothetical protein